MRQIRVTGLLKIYSQVSTEVYILFYFNHIKIKNDEIYLFPTHIFSIKVELDREVYYATCYWQLISNKNANFENLNYDM